MSTDDVSTGNVHLSTDQLADLGADVLSPDDAAAAQRHLQSCDDCRATSELLAGVPALLASVEAVSMPPEVTARVVAAIEREQISRAGEANEARSRDIARARPERAFARRLGARVGAGLLAATAVFGGGYLVLSGISSSWDDSPDSAAAPESVDEGPGVTGSEEAFGDFPTAAEDAGDMAYRSESLDEDVRALVGAPAPGTSRTSVPGEVIGPNGEIGEPDDVLTKCIAATKVRAGSKADPIAIDHTSTYDGVPAVVIVLPAGASRSESDLDVWVVGVSCLDLVPAESGSDDAADLDVLEHKTVTR